MPQDADFIIRLVFTVSKYGGAFPVTRWASFVTILIIIIPGVTLYFYILKQIFGALSSEPTVLGKILDIVVVVRVILVSIIKIHGYLAHKKHDIFEIVRSIYLTHDELRMLGLIPQYNRKPMSLLVLLFFAITAVEIGVYITTVTPDKSIDEIFAACATRFANRMSRHLYLAQMLSLMSISHDQMICMIKALVHKSHWFLESLVTVQSHVLKNVKASFTMFEKFLSFYVAYTAFAGIIYANRVHMVNSIWGIHLSFELMDLFLILGVFEKITRTANEFNNKLFDLMRDSNDLCNNKKLQLHVTLKPNVQFTACGFFNLDFSLVTSIVAAAATYLVILIQFSNAYSY